MKTITSKPSFTAGLKVIRKRRYNYDLLDKGVKILEKGETLPRKYKDHALSGNLKGFRECHIEANWLLIYRTNDEVLEFIATGSHDDLFK